MGIDLAEYSGEILDFVCTETLMEIDCGILDLAHIEDAQLKCILYYLEELLTVELLMNYRQNRTGIFRVYRFGDVWCYCERECVITARSCRELKESVVSKKRIWYVFDERLAVKLGGR